MHANDYCGSAKTFKLMDVDGQARITAKFPNGWRLAFGGTIRQEAARAEQG